MASYDRHLLDGEHLGHLTRKIKTFVVNGLSTKQNQIPTIVVTLSKVISQDPLQVQLTEEELGYIANNPFVFVDASALGMAKECWQTGTSMTGDKYYLTTPDPHWDVSSSDTYGYGGYVIIVNISSGVAQVFNPFTITRDDVDYWNDKQDKIPTIYITYDKIISQDPVKAQLTEEEFDSIYNSKHVYIDGSELGLDGSTFTVQKMDDITLLTTEFNGYDWSQETITIIGHRAIVIDNDSYIATLYLDFEISDDDRAYWNDKAERDLDATEGNIAVFDSDGNTEDSGYGVEEATTVPISTIISSSSTNSEIPGAKAVYDFANSKMEKDTDAVEGNIAKFDANGNAVDSDKPISAVLQVLTGSTDPTTSTIGNPGQFYINYNRKIIYQCVDNTNGIYVWNQILFNGIQLNNNNTEGVVIGGVNNGQQKYRCVGIGTAVQVSGLGATAIGGGSVSNSQGSIAIGYSSKSNKAGAIMLGTGTAAQTYALSVGFDGWYGGTTYGPYVLLDGLTGLIPYARMNDPATTIDAVLVPSRRYLLGTQSTLSLTLPTTAELGQNIEVVFSSGATACTLTCSLTGFDFVPKANTTNKIVFELIHKADASVTGDEDVWSVEIKEG